MIHKLLSGKISGEEHKVLQDFTDSYKQESAWDTSSGNKKELGEKIRDSLRLRIRKAERKKQAVRYMAAACVVLCMGLFFVWQYKTGGTAQLMVSTTSQIDSLTLADGSKIYLNRNTVFSYPEKFDGNSRTVKLISGGAYFKIARNEQKPFVIVSEDVKTEVLGTTFNIIKSDSTVNVTVSTGKVKVSTPSDSVELLADEQAAMHNRSGKLVKKKVKSQLYSSWMNKDIDYEDITLGELSTLVELRYGLPFHFEDPALKDYKVKVSFLKQDSLESVLSKLHFITNVKLKINKNVITVKSKEIH